MTEINIAEVLRMYNEENLSTHIIAEKLNTYPNKINRILRKEGKSVRNRSDAQKIALETGVSNHPTKGIKRPDDVKIKISEKSAAYWENLSDEERERRSNMCKERWNNLTDQEKDNLQKAASQSIREAAKNGSKAENFLVDLLQQNGYNVIFHGKSIVRGTEFEVDLFLPELQTVIEVDGPSHFSPIWGEEVLQKRRKADNEKNALLMSQKLIVIRLQYKAKDLSLKCKRLLSSIILNKLKEIKTGINKEQYIEMEIN